MERNKSKYYFVLIIFKFEFILDYIFVDICKVLDF